jgi:hypothetical protein
MQRVQNVEEKGFMTGEEIANVLLTGFERRQNRANQRPVEIFVSSEQFFNALIEDWVKDKRDVDVSDSRILPRDHRVAAYMNCNELADEWWKCFLTNPFDSSPLYAPTRPGFTSPFHFRNGGDDTNVAKAYMIGLSGFKYPDIRRIVVTERVPILIPIYVTSAAPEEQLWDPHRQAISVEPNILDTTLTDIVIDDLCGIYHMVAEFDRKPIKGCAVLRNVPFKVFNIPSDNVRGVPPERLSSGRSMSVCHGGFYLLLNPQSENMSRGEHLLYFKALSVNFEIEAKVHIGILAA